MGATVSKSFSAYVVPSVFAFALSGVYTIVDGFFIGQSMGDDGLAAITIGYPIAAFIMAIGTGLGLAGAIRYTILLARNQERQSRECFTNTTVLMTLVSLALTIGLFFLTEPILSILGATGRIHTMAAEYINVVVLGTIFQLLGTGFVPFIRNMNGSAFAMYAVIMGFVTNIILDYLFVWVWNQEMAGAAWATVLGQAVTLGLALIFFWRKKYGPRFSSFSETLRLWRETILVSFSPFGLNFTPQLTLMFINRFLLTYGDGQDVAAFGCVDYLLTTIYMLLQGVGDGSQPLISECYGREDASGVRSMRRKAYLFAGGIALISMLVCFLFRNQIGVLFGASSATNANVAYYLPLFTATLLLVSFTRVTTTYFYATEKTSLSYVLVYGESILTLLALFVCSFFFGLIGVWYSMPIAQLVLFMIAVASKRRVDFVCFHR